MSRFELSPSQVEFHMRELTEYEQKVLDFMNEREYTRGYGRTMLAARTPPSLRMQYSAWLSVTKTGQPNNVVASHQQDTVL